MLDQVSDVLPISILNYYTLSNNPQGFNRLVYKACQ